MLKAIYFVRIVLIVIVGSSGISGLLPSSNKPLLLTSYIESNFIKIGRLLARVNLKGAENVESYSGYLTVDKEYNTNLFFWFFPSKSNYTNDPVILWLQGGGKTSFMYGLFAEHGPFVVTQQEKLKLRDVSWVDRHSVLYIDSPLAGFSFSEQIPDFKQTNLVIQYYSAVRQFFKLFPEYRKNEFYIAGQSFAGKFVTSLAYQIMIRNEERTTKINLKGLAIGNAVIDPLRQYKYGNYLYQLGLIDDSKLGDFIKIEKSINNCVNNEDYEAYYENVEELRKTFYISTGHINRINYIDDEKTTHVLQKTYYFYVDDDDTRKAIHVGNTTYKVYSYIFDDTVLLPFSEERPKIIALLKNYRILFYTGQLDTVVTPARISEFLHSLNLTKPLVYNRLFRGPWVVDDEIAGYSKILGNLTELTVRVAGQMVPLDQPEWALDMITRFTRGERLLW